jgi:hypothetical protein
MLMNGSKTRPNAFYGTVFSARAMGQKLNTVSNPRSWLEMIMQLVYSLCIASFSASPAWVKTQY